MVHLVTGCGNSAPCGRAIPWWYCQELDNSGLSVGVKTGRRLGRSAVSAVYFALMNFKTERNTEKIVSVLERNTEIDFSAIN